MFPMFKNIKYTYHTIPFLRSHQHTRALTLPSQYNADKRPRQNHLPRQKRKNANSTKTPAPALSPPPRQHHCPASDTALPPPLAAQTGSLLPPSAPPRLAFGGCLGLSRGLSGIASCASCCARLSSRLLLSLSLSQTLTLTLTLTRSDCSRRRPARSSRAVWRRLRSGRGSAVCYVGRSRKALALFLIWGSGWPGSMRRGVRVREGSEGFRAGR